MIFNRDSGKNYTTYEGYCIDILNALASELKFTYEIEPCSDGAYGAVVNGRWNGMIGDLKRKVSLCSISLFIFDESNKIIFILTWNCFNIVLCSINKLQYITKNFIINYT